MSIVNLWSNAPELAVTSHTKQASILDKAADTAAHSPPNYRHADLTGPSCNSCTHFKLGTCDKYGTQVQADYVCDDFEPGVDASSFSGQATPLAPAQPIKPEEPATDTSSFKLGFMARCKDEGLTDEQIEERIDKALDSIDKQAALLPWLGLGGTLGLSAASSAMGAMPALAALGMGTAITVPAMAGAGWASKQHNDAKENMRRYMRNNKIDMSDFQNLELINEYNRTSDELQRTSKQREEEATQAAAPQRSRLYF